MTEENRNLSGTEGSKITVGRPRPLSPHLQIYKPQFSSVLSILHRASIVGMYLGILGFAAILLDYAFIEECQCAAWLRESGFGRFVTKVILSGFAIAASYWICATIRHLAWDLGKGYAIPTAWKTAKISMIATVILSLIIIFGAIL